MSTTTLPAAQTAAPSTAPGRKSFARRLFSNRSFVIGLALVGLIAVLAVLANVVAPYDPLKGNFRERMLAPNLNMFRDPRIAMQIMQILPQLQAAQSAGNKPAVASA